MSGRRAPVRALRVWLSPGKFKGRFPERDKAAGSPVALPSLVEDVGAPWKNRFEQECRLCQGHILCLVAKLLCALLAVFLFVIEGVKR